MVEDAGGQMRDGYDDVVLRGHWPDGTLEIIEAAPRSLIDYRLLNQICDGSSPHVTLDGDVLTIRATNRMLVYRIVGRHPDRINHPHEWVIEWPD
jgi:hypothetical protein